MIATVTSWDPCHNYLGHNFQHTSLQKKHLSSSQFRGHRHNISYQRYCSSFCSHTSIFQTKPVTGIINITTQVRITVVIIIQVFPGISIPSYIVRYICVRRTTFTNVECGVIVQKYITGVNTCFTFTAGAVLKILLVNITIIIAGEIFELICKVVI